MCTCFAITHCALTELSRSCAQLKITNGGSGNPAKVAIPGVYTGEILMASITTLSFTWDTIGNEPGILISEVDSSFDIDPHNWHAAYRHLLPYSCDLRAGNNFTSISFSHSNNVLFSPVLRSGVVKFKAQMATGYCSLSEEQLYTSHVPVKAIKNETLLNLSSFLLAYLAHYKRLSLSCVVNTYSHCLNSYPCECLEFLDYNHNDWIIDYVFEWGSMPQKRVALGYSKRNSNMRSRCSRDMI